MANQERTALRTWTKTSIHPSIPGAATIENHNPASVQQPETSPRHSVSSDRRLQHGENHTTRHTIHQSSPTDHGTSGADRVSDQTRKSRSRNGRTYQDNHSNGKG